MEQEFKKKGKRETKQIEGVGVGKFVTYYIFEDLESSVFAYSYLENLNTRPSFAKEKDISN